MSMIDYDARPVTPQVLLVGQRASSIGYSIRDFLSRNGVPYEWVDVDDDQRVARRPVYTSTPLSAAHRQASGSMSVATTHPGRARPNDKAMAPDPVHRSAARPSGGKSWTARRTRASVCHRGT